MLLNSRVLLIKSSRSGVEKMKQESHKLAVICRSVGLNPNEVYEVFRRIRKAVMEDGGEVITHELGTFFRSERSETRKVLGGVEYLVPARTCLALKGVKGPGLDQMEVGDICSTEEIPTGIVTVPFGLNSISRSGRVEAMEGTRLVIRHEVLPARVEVEPGSFVSPFFYSWTTTLSSPGMAMPERFGVNFAGGVLIQPQAEYFGIAGSPNPGDVVDMELNFIDRLEANTWNTRIVLKLNDQEVTERFDVVDRCNVDVSFARIDNAVSAPGAAIASDIVPSIQNAVISKF